MPFDEKDIEWIFSGIGTYGVQILIGIIVFFVVGRAARNIINKKHVEGDIYHIKQGGFFNKMKLKFNKKDK
ncbi:hypothetical protein CGH85_19985 [Vibrio parahaemolyticus]|uniref:hypothetical protein n=1 Tax=Vibrio parahaemolyticus TaxID=670 RepID=UPI00111EAFD5|nr:hypothetical protein [Vibrio parahaemolyticus]EGQ9249694.1 hypothetical protein [Vibrio parahaemolyticus]EJU9840060.1 hypothetical protein [Vibrio parahaemolyticus]EKO5219218.1 hypothetical protein [Vibrio parahaemolyticus]ELB2269341.1 hypothetical protein [Vibrio parahaemolyticus]MBM5079320.1 hypothetical protein [Vibrio parahaemolyticus]